MGRPFVATLLLGGLYGNPVRAEGKTPSKIDCIAADTDGQSLRLQNKLRAALKRFAICGSASCPKIVRDDCLQRIDEVEIAQPTVIFTATNGNGRPLRAVKAFVDDALLAERLDGQPLAIDPGEHVFTFKALGRMDAEMSFVIHEGEKQRHVVVLRSASGEAAGADPATTKQASPVAETSSGPSSPPNLAASSTPATMIPATVHPEARPATADPNSTTRDIAVGVGAGGIVGLVVGSIFGVFTLSNWNAAQRDCGSACPANSAGQREERSAATDGTVSSVAFVAGGAAVAAGVLLWFFTPESPSSQMGVRIVPRVSARRGDISLESRF